MYLLLCPCNLGYVGETGREFRSRLGEYKSCIRTRKLKAPLVNHCIENGPIDTDIRWLIFEKIKTANLLSGSKRQEREAFWIFTLETCSGPK